MEPRRDKRRRKSATFANAWGGKVSFSKKFVGDKTNEWVIREDGRFTRKREPVPFLMAGTKCQVMFSGRWSPAEATGEPGEFWLFDLKLHAYPLGGGMVRVAA
jgi:hypothetical protein